MPIKSFFRRSSAPTRRATSIVDQPQREATPPSMDETSGELVVKRTFLHFALGKRRAFGRRRSTSESCRNYWFHRAPANAADSPEKASSKESMESRRSVISILATDDERVEQALWTSTHSLSSLREDLPMLLPRPVERLPHDCPSASTIQVVDDALPEVQEASFVLTGDERYVHDGCDDCCDEDDDLSSTRDDASVFSDDDGFCDDCRDDDNDNDGFCDDCRDDEQKIFSMSTAVPDNNSIRDDASVVSDDFCDHAEGLDEESDVVNLADDSSDSAVEQPATPMVMPLAVPCVINLVVLQPQPIDKETKAKFKSKKSKATDPAAASQPQLEARTSVMLRHLPRDLSRDELLELLDAKGFHGKYDFVYLPMHFLEQANLGYAFINLTVPEHAPAFWKDFDGLRKWPKLGTKVLRVGWSNPHQGLEAHVERYRNSPIMHPSVPEDIQPLLFKHGQRVVFPSPTKNVRAPRVRGARGEPAFWNA